MESPRGSGDLDKHIHWILDILNPDLEMWRSVKSKYEPDIFFGLFLDADNRGAGISAGNLLELGRRGIDIVLDIYSRTTDEHED